jgi:hypothetical protein
MRDSDQALVLDWEESMTYDELRDSGFVDELAEVFDEEAEAKVLLDEVGVPRRRLKRFEAPIDFWNDVCRKLRDGVIEGGLEKLVRVTAKSRPGYKFFQEMLKRLDEPPRSLLSRALPLPPPPPPAVLSLTIE